MVIKSNSFLFVLLVASKQVYRPPHARNSDFKPTSLHEESTLETSTILFTVYLLLNYNVL